jgi:hypothetical protein
MKDWKRPYLRALNTDVSARIHSHWHFSCNHFYPFLRDKKKLGSARFPQPAASADEAACVRGGARVWSSSFFSHFHILVVEELTLYVGAYLS